MTVTESVTTTSTTTAPSPATTAIVIELQQVMTDLGYYTGPIDGVYGEGTTDAVKTMQTDLGVTADGIYGAETHNALKGKGASIVTSLQNALTTYGYYDGPIDGDYGEATTARWRSCRPTSASRRTASSGPRRPRRSTRPSPRAHHAEVASVASAISRTTSTMSRFAL